MDLAKGILSGEKAAEEALVKEFARSVTAMLRARTRDADIVPDLVQDVMIAVIEALRSGQLREPDKLSAYIRGVTRNIANNWVRERIRRPREASLDVEPVANVAADDPLESSERARLVHEAIDRLDGVDREILLRTLLRGEKPGRIAQQLGIGVEALRQRKSRSIKKVAEFVRQAVTKRP